MSKRNVLILIFALLPVAVFAGTLKQNLTPPPDKCTIVVMFRPTGFDDEILGLNSVNVFINENRIRKLPVNYYLTFEVSPQDLLFYFHCRSKDNGNGDVSMLNIDRSTTISDFHNYYTAELLEAEAGQTYYICVYRPSFNLLTYTFRQELLDEETALALLPSMTKMPVLWNEIGREVAP